MTHDKSSKEEYKRYEVLKLRQAAKEISHLKHQPDVLVVAINNIEVFKYTPDFRYVEAGAFIFEEYKGYMRERHDSLLRMKCASAVYTGIEFRLYEGSGKNARLTRVYLNGKAVRQSKKKDK